MFTTTSSSATTANVFATSNLTATITPTSANNRILVFITSGIQINVANKQAFLTLARGGSNILASNGFAEAFSGTFTSQMNFPLSLIYLDSPATTSPTTYALQMRNSDGTTSIEIPGTTLTQIMILVEIGA